MSEHCEGMEELKRGRGRPKKEGARSHEAKVRFNETEMQELNDLSSVTGESKSELLRKAFKMYNNFRKYQVNSEDLE